MSGFLLLIFCTVEEQPLFLVARLSSLPAKQRTNYKQFIQSTHIALKT